MSRGRSSREAAPFQSDERRELLYSLLGDLPPRARPVSAQRTGVEERESYILEKLLLDLNGIDPVPAYFVKPKGTARPPVVLFNHSHGNRYELGKDELLVGNTYLADPPYAEELARAGFAALAIDAWGFGERRGLSETELFASRCASTSAASPTSTALIESRALDGHGVYFYVPSLLKHFTAAEINALIAPRPHLSLAGKYDRLVPASGLDRIEAFLRDVYAACERPHAWRLVRFGVGHVETHAMRRLAVDFLREWL